MSPPTLLEIANPGQVRGLVPRILAGDVVVLRGGLQRAGVYDAIVDGSLQAIAASVGEATAARVREGGFDRIHEWVAPEDIPGVTEAVYEVLTPQAGHIVRRLVPALFPDAGSYYFERSPNVRFHIPYDRAAAHKRKFSKFAQLHGEGKVTAHGPHRDPWVDCPANAVNVWIAIGPVQRGNGLTVFAEDYGTDFPFKDGYLEPGFPLHKPFTFDLQPGDAVLFHSNHLHGSELNQTDRTRYVVSFRITFGKPHYPHGHYHHYLHAGLAEGPLRRLAGIPQNLQASFFRYQLRRIRYKLTGKGRMTGADSASPQVKSAHVTPTDGCSVALADLPVGAIKPVSAQVCVARLGPDRFQAVSRRCPHMGGDLVDGWIDDGKLVCPLHNLHFDPHTGASRCSSLASLRTFPCTVRGERVHVDTTAPAPATITDNAESAA
jgi:nitrite reductase/ring-hydroxylating ferredoxin subunit